MRSAGTRPRVLILATRVPLRSGDGTPSFVLDNATALSGEFDITILAPRVRGSKAVTVQGGVTVKRFPYFPARWERLADEAIMPQLGKNRLLWAQAVPLSAMMVWSAFREHRSTSRVEILHAHWVLPAALVSFMIQAVFGTPYIVTSQGADAFRLNRGPLRRINRAVLNRSARLVGVSQDIVDQFAPIRCEASVQPSGVDFRLWNELVSEREPVSGHVLFVGRLAEKKGVADAIRAVARKDGLCLRVVGDGPLEDELKGLATSMGIGDRVTFLGRLAREQIAAEMRTAMCLTIPSVTAADGDRDGTPNVLGEAIASGVPVVASRLAGLAEYIVDGETGLLHEPGDVAGLAGHLESLMASSETCKKLAERARSMFTPQLDINAVAKTYARWYRELISAAIGARDVD